MHQTLGALNAKSGGGPPKFVAHSNPLPLSLLESVELDSVLLVLAALFVLVPFCLLSGEPPTPCCLIHSSLLEVRITHKYLQEPQGLDLFCCQAMHESSNSRKSPHENGKVYTWKHVHRALCSRPLNINSSHFIILQAFFV